jgi:hypothetical protein
MAETFTVNTTFEYSDSNGIAHTIEAVGFSIDTATNYVKLDQKIPVNSSTHTTVLTMGADAAGGLTSVNYVVIENLDTTNALQVKVFDTGGHTAYIKIPAEGHYTLMTSNMEVDESETAFSAYSTTDTITVLNAASDTDFVRILAIGT